jgi:hypothetical protein
MTHQINKALASPPQPRLQLQPKLQPQVQPQAQNIDGNASRPYQRIVAKSDGCQNFVAGETTRAKGVQDPNYNPFRIRTLKDEVLFGNMKKDKVKEKYPKTTFQIYSI